MKAYKCDICGRYYNVNQYTSKTDPISKKELEFRPGKVKFLSSNGQMSTNEYDMCPDCIDRISKFVDDTRVEAKASGIEPPIWQ